MKLVESIMTKNPCYTAGKKITVKGLMLHSVGCAQPKASVFINKWNTASYKSACVHGFIDGNDGTVYQTLPWDHRGWHCGASANNTHIGVEMCEPACIKYTSGANFTCSDTDTAKAVAKRTYEAAVDLFAMLCEKYSLDPLGDGVIISHKEGYARGVASNHGDPEHLWTQLGMSYTMDTFRQAVKAAMGGTATTTTAATTTATTSSKTTSTKTSSAKTMTNADCPFSVRVSITSLNIRKGPGTNYNKTGAFTGKGVFTITAVQSGTGSTKGWGKLKSGSGWISLDYCTRT